MITALPTSAASAIDEEFLDSDPQVIVQESEYKRLLGLPADYVLQERTLELAQWAREWYSRHGHPWIYARRADCELDEASVLINGQAFNSSALTQQISEAFVDSAWLVAVGAGPECEEMARQLWTEGKPDEYFFLEIFGSAVVEQLVMSASARLCAWADQRQLAILPHHSPGYSGWDIRDQKPLFHLIQSGKNPRFPSGLNVLESGMLQPKKSLLGVFGVTARLDLARTLARLVPCENCALNACNYRRGPYKHSLPQLEDVRNLQRPRNPSVSNGNGHANGGLDPRAPYTFNLKALRKWSEERLVIEPAADRSLRARFRYEGTTCSNLGQPIQYVYDVTLGRPDEGYPIRVATCHPAAEDTGHKAMCAFISNGDQLFAEMAREKPLHGKRLSEVFKWHRTYSPAGCYCDADSRQHKWGLVFEVLHFALAEREKRLATQPPTA
jgi:hypothetical protein